MTMPAVTSVITHVASGQVNGLADGTGHLNGVYGAPPTVGSLLVLRCNANAAFGAAPPGWNAAGAFPIDFTVAALYWRIATGGDVVPPIASTAGAVIVGQIDEYASSTGWATSALDGYAATNTNALSVPTGLTGVTVQADELACAVFGAPGIANPSGLVANGTIVPTTPYAQRGSTLSSGGSSGLVCVDAILGTTGTTGCTGTWSGGGISNASAIIATFKAAPVSGAIVDASAHLTGVSSMGATLNRVVGAGAHLVGHSSMTALALVVSPLTTTNDYGMLSNLMVPPPATPPTGTQLAAWLSITATDAATLALLDGCCTVALQYELGRLSTARMNAQGFAPPEVLPGPVAQAVLMRAAAIYRRRNSVNGFEGFADLGAMAIRASDPDIERLVDPWRAWAFA